SVLKFVLIHLTNGSTMPGMDSPQREGRFWGKPRLAYKRRVISMTTDGGAERIGTLIRQIRRQRNITQTALGAPRYSKSYISGVEKNIIRPSPKALEFFAEQLGQPRDYFTALLWHPESMKQEAALQ